MGIIAIKFCTADLRIVYLHIALTFRNLINSRKNIQNLIRSKSHCSESILSTLAFDGALNETLQFPIDITCANVSMESKLFSIEFQVADVF